MCTCASAFFLQLHISSRRDCEGIQNIMLRQSLRMMEISVSCSSTFLVIFQSTATNAAVDPFAAHVMSLSLEADPSVAKLLNCSRSVEHIVFPRQQDCYSTVCDLRTVHLTPSWGEHASCHARSLAAATLRSNPSAFESAKVMFVLLPSMSAMGQLEIIKVLALHMPSPPPPPFCPLDSGFQAACPTSASPSGRDFVY
jgi:hypothetical protein